MWISINTNDKEVMKVIKILDKVIVGLLEDKEISEVKKNQHVPPLLKFRFKILIQLYRKTKDKKLKENILKHFLRNTKNNNSTNNNPEKTNG